MTESVEPRRRAGRSLAYATTTLTALMVSGVLGIVSATTRPAAVQFSSPPAESEPRPWRHLALTDLGVDPTMFEPVRGRYLQVMYDLEGREQSQFSTMVHLDVDQIVHSGPWDGTVPATIEPLREPGLVIVWQIQNALYNGFDRVQTDRNLSVRQRVMPGGSGLIIGSTSGDEHTRIHAATGPDETIQVDRTPLPDGAINVLTMPYVLAAMKLEAGDRFTLPGYALINGPDGRGQAWRGAFEVVAVDDRRVGDRTMRVAEVLFNRLGSTEVSQVEQIDRNAPGHRVTRLMISAEPPYLLGRANLKRGPDGDYVYIREYLGLIDWAVQPLALSDYASENAWDLDLEAGSMRLKDSRTSPALVPLRNP